MKSPAEDSRGGGDHLLICDPEEDSRQALGHTLQDEGYQVDLAGTGEECLKIVSDRRPDAILLSANPPDTDLNKLIDSIKQFDLDTAIIVLTEMAQRVEAIEAMTHGAWAYVVKPFRFEELFATVLQVLERRRLNLQNKCLIARLREELYEKARVEDALYEREKRYRAVFENAGAGIALCDVRKNGQIVSANGTLQSILGFNEEELQQRRLLELTHEEDKEETEQRYRTLLEGKCNACQWVKRYRHKEGHYIWVDVASSLIRDGRGGPSLVVAVANDVTERVLAEEEVQMLQKSLADLSAQEQSRLGRDLFDGVNQSMAGLGYLMRSLQNHLSNSGNREEKAVKGMLEELQRVMREVKNIARGLAPVAVAAGNLMAALETLCRSTEEISGVRCKFVCDRPIQIYDTTAASHLYRIAQEAITNAVAHSGADTVKIELSYTSERFRLIIRDSGKGIVPSKHRSDGMGLKMMRYRARLIGADLEVDSLPGRGTTIICSLTDRKGLPE